MATDFHTEMELSRREAAAYLREFADEIEENGRVVLLSGDRSRTVNPAELVRFRVDTTTDTSWLGSENGRSVSFEIGWNVEDAPESNEFAIVTDPGETDRVERKAREIREDRLDEGEHEERRHTTELREEPREG